MEAKNTENRPTKSVFKRFFKVTSIIFGVTFLLFALLVLFAWIFEDQIGKYAIDQLNKQIKTKIEYKELRLSMIKRFPMATLEFSDVKVEEATAAKNKNDLLKANRIYLQFSIWDLIIGTYSIKKIEIENAKVRMRIFENGDDNFHIFKESDDTTSQKFNLNLKNVKLKKVDFGFIDYQSKQHHRIIFNKATAKGNFNQDNYSLDFDGSLFIHEINYDSVQYIKNKDAALKLTFLVDTKKQSYTLKKGHLTLNKIPFKLDGSIVYSDIVKSINLNISGDDLKLHSFIEELPSSMKGYFSKFESTGFFNFNLLIDGKLGAKSPLKILLKSELKNGKITNKENNLSLENVNFSLQYSNGDKGSLNSSSIRFNNFEAQLKSGLIKGNFNVNNLNKPKIETKVVGKFNLDDVEKFLKMDVIKKMDGKIDINADVKISLKSWSNITPSDFLDSETSGTIEIKNGTLELKNYPIPVFVEEGNFKFNKSDIDIQQMKGKIGKSDYQMTGSFVNILPYFFLKDQQLNMDATLQSNLLNFDELLKSDEKKSETGLSISFSPNINFNVKLKNKHLKFGKFQPNDISANLKMKNQVLTIENLKMNIFGGNISASANINGRATNKKLLCTVRSEISDVDISKLFYSFNNFGQAEDGLTDKKIKGKINSSIQMSSLWNQDLTPDLEVLKSSINMTIDNGEINNYQTLNSLAKFINLKDLQQVKFKKLTNKFEILNQKIIFPEMEIESNAINIKLSGVHYFDNRIDYHVKVRLSELLSKKAKKAKKENEDFGDIEDDGLQRTTLYILITGTTDNPVVKYDSKNARKKIMDDIKKEKQNIKEIFKKEFGSSKTDSIRGKTIENKKEKENIKKQENGKFVIEWDD